MAGGGGRPREMGIKQDAQRSANNTSNIREHGKQIKQTFMIYLIFVFTFISKEKQFFSPLPLPSLLPKHIFIATTPSLCFSVPLGWECFCFLRQKIVIDGPKTITKRSQETGSETKLTFCMNLPRHYS